jgi:hypothetical protein
MPPSRTRFCAIEAVQQRTDVPNVKAGTYEIPVVQAVGEVQENTAENALVDLDGHAQERGTSRPNRHAPPGSTLQERRRPQSLWRHAGPPLILERWVGHFSCKLFSEVFVGNLFAFPTTYSHFRAVVPRECERRMGNAGLQLLP